MSETQHLVLNRSLFILKYLMMNTDDEHKASFSDIMSYCDSNGHGASRMTVSKDIETLIHYGFDIIAEKDGNRKTYHYGVRPLETVELHMLMDMVSSAPFISKSKAQSLSNRIASLSSKHEAACLSELVHPGQEIHTDNCQFFVNLDIIRQALSKKRLITFQYTMLNPNRERMLCQRGKPILFSPCMTTLIDGHYWICGLVLSKTPGTSWSMYRIDRIKAVKLLEKEALPIPSEFNPSDCRRQMVYHGSIKKEVNVDLLCDNSAMLTVVDRFGDTFPFEHVDDTHFRATVRVYPSQPFFTWLFDHAKVIHVCGPDEVVEKYLDSLKQAVKMIQVQ